VVQVVRDCVEYYFGESDMFKRVMGFAAMMDGPDHVHVFQGAFI
jgi:hypothetical protein